MKNLYILCLMIFASLLLFQQSYSTTIYSTVSGGNRSWTSASTWVGGIVPGTNDDVVINGHVELTTTDTINNLIVNKFFNGGGSLLINGDLTNNDSIYLSTIIVMNNVINNNALFCNNIKVHKNLTNTGIWIPSNTYFVDSTEKLINFSNGTQFGTSSLRGNIILDSNTTIVLSNNLTVFSHIFLGGGGTLNAGNFNLTCKNSNIYGCDNLYRRRLASTIKNLDTLKGGFYLNYKININCDLNAKGIHGFYNSSIGDTVTVHGNLKLYDSLNCSLGVNLYIDSSFINYSNCKFRGDTMRMSRNFYNYGRMKDDFDWVILETGKFYNYNYIGSGSQWYIGGNLYNKGVFTDDPLHDCYVYIYSDSVFIDGIWNNNTTTFMDNRTHHLWLNDTTHLANELFWENASVNVDALSNLSFTNRFVFNGGSLHMNNHNLLLRNGSEYSSFYETANCHIYDIDTLKGYLCITDTFHIYNRLISRDTINLWGGSKLSCNNDLYNLGLIKFPGDYTGAISVDSSLFNYGTIYGYNSYTGDYNKIDLKKNFKNYGLIDAYYGSINIDVLDSVINKGVIVKTGRASFNITAHGNIVNDSLWNISKTKVNGDEDNEDQYIILKPEKKIDVVARFESDVTGAGYQWLKNDVPIPYATNSYYENTTLDCSDAGTYKCRVAQDTNYVYSRNIIVSCQVPPEPLIPIEPIGIVCDTLVRFRWFSIAGDTNQYQLQVSTTEGFIIKIVDTVITDTVITYLPGFFANNVIYYWRIRSANSNAWVVRSFTLKWIYPPLIIEPSGGICDENPVFRWESVYCADRYNLQISTDPDFESMIVDVSVNTNSYANSNSEFFQTFVDYYWRVRSYRGNDASEWSNKSFIIKAPVTPVQVSPCNVTILNQYPLLTWVADDRIDNYDLEIENSNGRRF